MGKRGGAGWGWAVFGATCVEFAIILLMQSYQQSLCVNFSHGTHFHFFKENGCLSQKTFQSSPSNETLTKHQRMEGR